ncbi:Os05g0317101 [Oryza sativa Japonica Group]|uniref:Os05g0317101 protein n=1 Tax=Oryza sativa subsp. japonica TaxID=39947 RepID=A0A0P0WKP0_ORYSJ|nr:Os05g0317101 [Oryza sativa Japonica Group]
MGGRDGDVMMTSPLTTATILARASSSPMAVNEREQRRRWQEGQRCNDDLPSHHRCHPRSCFPLLDDGEWKGQQRGGGDGDGRDGGTTTASPLTAAVILARASSSPTETRGRGKRGWRHNDDLP